MTEITKFALYDFAGKPREFFIVSEDTVPKPVLEPTVSHHVVVIDRSGSMYSVMDDTKTMVEKVMCVEEYRTSGLLLTLISYSSKGDYTVHFSRTKVEDVLAPGSAHVKSLRSIRATCLTSVSGALNETLAHIAPGETTAITVHTDGWFNDASPASESKEVNKWIKRVQKELPNVFVNTVAYGDPRVVTQIANKYGSQAVVACVDYSGNSEALSLLSAGGRKVEKVTLQSHLANLKSAGVGEVMLQSVDRDGKMAGYDLVLLREVAAQVSMPLIIAGGAGSFADLVGAFAAGADGAACGSLFNFGDNNPLRAKAFLKNQGVCVKRIG